MSLTPGAIAGGRSCCCICRSLPQFVGALDAAAAVHGRSGAMTLHSPSDLKDPLQLLLTTVLQPASAARQLRTAARFGTPRSRASFGRLAQQIVEARRRLLAAASAAARMQAMVEQKRRWGAVKALVESGPSLTKRTAAAGADTEVRSPMLRQGQCVVVALSDHSSADTALPMYGGVLEMACTVDGLLGQVVKISNQQATMRSSPATREQLREAVQHATAVKVAMAKALMAMTDQVQNLTKAINDLRNDNDFRSSPSILQLLPLRRGVADPDQPETEALLCVHALAQSKEGQRVLKQLRPEIERSMQETLVKQGAAVSNETGSGQETKAEIAGRSVTDGAAALGAAPERKEGKDGTGVELDGGTGGLDRVQASAELKVQAFELRGLVRALLVRLISIAANNAAMAAGPSGQEDVAAELEYSAGAKESVAAGGGEVRADDNKRPAVDTEDNVVELPVALFGPMHELLKDVDAVTAALLANADADQVTISGIDGDELDEFQETLRRDANELHSLVLCTASRVFSGFSMLLEGDHERDADPIADCAVVIKQTRNDLFEIIARYKARAAQRVVLAMATSHWEPCTDTILP